MTREKNDQKDFTRVDGERRAAGRTGSTAASNEVVPTDAESYDTHQRRAAHLCWRCCGSEVFATRPAYGCLQCR